MLRRRFLYVSLLVLSVTAFLVTWLADSPGKEPRAIRPEPRPLDDYRRQFRRPDGSLLSDAELRQLLQAKGIPYQETCPDGPNCSSGAATAVLAIPQVDFSTAGITAPRRDELRVAIATAVGGQLEAMRRINPELRLERIAVDSGMKLQLHFNKQFEQIAEDETKLNEFSEGLHSLGVAGLRGSVVYIEGQPLGLYLQKKDAERNQKARAESPENGGDNRR